MEKSAVKRHLYADLLRVLAVFFVILVHSAAKLMVEWDTLPLDWWLWGNAYDSLARACVPLFVMLSGALMLDRQEPTGVFFKKRLSKLLIPFAFWVAAYINWRIFYVGEVLPVDRIVVEIFTGPVYYHLWYLYMVLGLYLITPALRRLLTVAGKQELQYLSGLWLVFNSVLPLILYLVWLYVGYSVNLGVKIPLVAGYSGYFILGWALARAAVPPPEKLGLWAGLYGLGSVLVFLGTWLFTDAAGEFQAVLFDYFSLPVALQAVALFMLLRGVGNLLEDRLSEKSRHRWAVLGKYSFGMYLIHVMLLELLEGGGLGFRLHGTGFYPALAIPVTAAVLFAGSWALVALLSRIPLLKHTVVEQRARKRSAGFRRLPAESREEC